MNLINFKNDNNFNQLRKIMGAEYFEGAVETDWRIRGAKEIEIQIDQGVYAVENLNEVIIDKEGILRYEGKAVIVYIPDSESYKYHISNCTALRRMKSEGRYDRYILTRRTDGKFKILPKYRNEYFARLDLCKYCQYEIDYYKYSDSKGFNIQSFFMEKNKTLSSTPKIPRYSDSNAPVNHYTSDFAKISNNTKQLKNYICESCGKDLSRPNLKKFLHTHHINGRKEDNYFSNLKVLCIKCHSHQPSHEHMLRSEDYREYEMLLNLGAV